MKCVGRGQMDISRKQIQNIKLLHWISVQNVTFYVAWHRGCDVTVLPATATAEEVLAHNPDGVFLSNGPGDPAATGEYAVPMIKTILDTTDLPVFGICLGHQMLALALGAKTVKMNHGHHGANHPVKENETGKVEITSMNHGFAVDAQTLPEGVVETHVSLFDGSNCGIRMKDRPVFSVQHHPEASPGPQDSFYLFERFAASWTNRSRPAILGVENAMEICWRRQSSALSS